MFFNIKISSVIYFLVGISIAGTNLPKVPIRNIYTFTFGFIWVLCAILRAVPYFGLETFMAFSSLLYYILTIVGSLFFWSLVSKSNCLTNILDKNHINTFWVYCCHMPLMLIFKSAERYIFNMNDIVLLISALVNPWLTLTICIFFEQTIMNYCTWLHTVLTGNRQSPISTE